MNTWILRILNCSVFSSEDRCEVITTCGTKEEIGLREDVEWEGCDPIVNTSTLWTRQSKRNLQRILKNAEGERPGQGIIVVLTLREVSI